MTQFATLNQKSLESSKIDSSPLRPHNDDNPANAEFSLQEAIVAHINKERVSFHTPGHKGREEFSNTLNKSVAACDLTELPGLDQLADPQTCIAAIEQCAASVWQAQTSILSVNGASAPLIAAILSVADRGEYILLPRNVHTSVLHGLVLSGLKPLWYEPQWLENWGLWGAVQPSELLAGLIASLKGEPKSLPSPPPLPGRQLTVAAVIVVSPTYAGVYSDISALSRELKKLSIPLIVDEAHGAHALPAASTAQTAAVLGADLVIHSLHKTLAGWTQSGIIHIGKDSLIEASKVRSALQMVQSTSPSYPLLASIEQACRMLQTEAGGKQLQAVSEHALKLRRGLARFDWIEVLDSDYAAAALDPWHILINASGREDELHEFLTDAGIFPETRLGRGILFMLGIGTSSEDVDLLIDRLTSFSQPAKQAEAGASIYHACKPPAVNQVITPREAFFMPSYSVPKARALNSIAAECISPCPPGLPLCVPGQLLTKEVLQQIPQQTIRIVVPAKDDDSRSITSAYGES